MAKTQRVADAQKKNGVLVSWSGFPVHAVPGVRRADWGLERAFQVACADWLRKQYELTKIEHYLRWHHSANEREGARAGFLAKMMGQAKGWPDFVQPWTRQALELKVKGGVVGVEQERWLDYLGRAGWQVEVVWTIERFKELVIEGVLREAREEGVRLGEG